MEARVEEPRAVDEQQVATEVGDDDVVSVRISPRILPGSLSPADIRQHLQIAAGSAPQDTAFVLGQLAESSLLGAVAFAGIGQCVRAAPPSEVYIEMDDVGVHYRCSHAPPHVYSVP
jgi:hypothetical protein